MLLNIFEWVLPVLSDEKRRESQHSDMQMTRAYSIERIIIVFFLFFILCSIRIYQSLFL